MIVGFIAPTDYSRACTLSVSIRAMAYNSGATRRRHPSATRDTATEINVRSGEEVSGVDIRHRGDRGHIVSGSVSGELESSSSYNRVPVTLRGARTGASRIGPGPPTQAGLRSMALPDGAYELIATRSSNDGETSGSARRPVSVRARM